MRPAQDSMLARHTILHEVGRGAIGAVYAARDRSTGTVVALKRLDPALLKADPGLAGRFLMHADAARRLRHPHIVRIHDAGEGAGTAYVAMEMLEGESLRDILAHGPLPVARAIRIADEIALGLAYAHLGGLTHGGLKPSNVIVLRSGAAKITDFGIGQLGPDPAYLSPEQVRGEPADYRSDVFSLGILFYEMLTHRRPFEGDSPKQVAENILQAEPPPPSELNKNVPRALDAIVASMLAKEPAARMPGVPVLLRELQELDDGLGLGAVPKAEPAASAAPAAPEPALSLPGDDFQHRPIQISDRDVLDYARTMTKRESRPERSSRSGPAIFAALALAVAVVAVALPRFVGPTGFTDRMTGLVDDWSDRIQRGIAELRQQEAPATPGASRPPAPPPAAEAREEPVPVKEPAKEPVTAPAAPPAAQAPAPVATEPDAPEETESVVASAPEKPEPPPRAEPPKRLPRAAQPTARRPAQPIEKTAQLILAISPRGELYVDGEHRGSTPPITAVDLEPGIHRIEVRSGSRTPYLTYMTVQAGEVRRIRYDFDAKGSRPPPR